MDSKTKEFREQLAHVFIKSLEEKQLDWKKNWKSFNGSSPRNAVTDGKYKGINSFYLGLLAFQNKYTDPRWATFLQIKDQGWNLKRGSKGVTIEYWMPYDQVEKKFISWEKFNKWQKDAIADANKRVYLRARYYTVFHASNIEGIPPLAEPVKDIINPNKLIEKISISMNVTILHDRADARAYYSVFEDRIHLPAIDMFFSDYDYNATVLHELAHSTGAKHRLDRLPVTQFGTDTYAYEELVAEITSSFMCSELKFEQTSNQIDNHKAYVQFWISGLKEKPEALITAIRDAERAADYLGFHAGLITQNEYEKNQGSTMEVKAEMTEPQAVSIAQAPNISPEANKQPPKTKNVSDINVNVGKEGRETVKLAPELREKLQRMEKEGITFSITKTGNIRIPATAMVSLSRSEIIDTRNYIKQIVKESEVINTNINTNIKNIFTEITR